MVPKFDRRIGVSAAETPVKFLNDMIILTPNLTVPILGAD